jgi:hypothetical protein
MKNEGICAVTVDDLFLELKKLKEEVFILRQDLDEVNKYLDDIDRKEDEDKRRKQEDGQVYKVRNTCSGSR